MGLFGLNSQEKAIWRMIKPQDTVKIKIKDNPEEKYFTKVADISDSFLFLYTPLLGTTFIEFPKNIKVEVELFTPDGGRIRFVSRVLSQDWIKERIIKLSKPRSIERVQLRSYYRLEAILDVEYSLVSSMEIYSLGLELKHPLSLALTRDISEGGALLIVDKRLEKDNLINMRIKLPDSKAIRTRAKVLRVEETQAKGKYAVGVEFVKMDEDDKELLRRFIFNRGKERYLKMK
ncbi:MAG: PilZ domain-containing protein [Candidatus Omnitrophica bacterium]|nr:PilZ domain-containing protein [Candidatus Omnitrophota bacterium]MCM8826406.1 PilZ domain-containing protein [Candidatus Omnitrophota bacterium]